MHWSELELLIPLAAQRIVQPVDIAGHHVEADIIKPAKVGLAHRPDARLGRKRVLLPPHVDAVSAQECLVAGDLRRVLQ